MMDRYIKHINFEPIGINGQQKFLNSKVLIIGAGGLGTNFANHFVRAGIGEILIVDRDKVELGNLQRQWLYDEEDIGQQKALAAVKKLRKVNSTIKINSIVDNVNANNVDDLIHGFDLIMDATDNFKTRFIIDDACFKQNKPWIFTGILGAQAQTMIVMPGITPRLKDVLGFTSSESELVSGSGLATFPNEPSAESSVLAPSVSMISSAAVLLAFKVLLNKHQDVLGNLFIFDTWENSVKKLPLRR